MAFLISTFLIIIFWVVGYYPGGIMPIILFEVGETQVRVAHIFLFLAILLLAYSIRRPFRKFGFALIAIWTVNLLGFSFEQIIPGMIAFGGITLSKINFVPLLKKDKGR
jgi:hypothetical protein